MTDYKTLMKEIKDGTNRWRDIACSWIRKNNYENYCTTQRNLQIQCYPCQNCCLFDDNHSDRCEVVSHCGFDLHSLMISDAEHHSMCFFGHLYVFCCCCLISLQVLYPFINQLVWFFDDELYNFFVYFGY